MTFPQTERKNKKIHKNNDHFDLWVEIIIYVVKIIIFIDERKKIYLWIDKNICFSSIICPVRLYGPILYRVTSQRRICDQVTLYIKFSALNDK